MPSEPVLFSLADGVATLTLNRPEAGNAVDFALARALFEASIRCETDPAIRSVILTGAGRLFCAGGDIALFAAERERAPAMLSELAGTLHLAVARLARMAKPLVVLVNGPAAGAGFGLSLIGDVVLADPAAHFTAAYAALGLTPDGGLSWTLPRLVGLRRAQEIMLLNRRVKVDEAAAIGLVTRVAAPGALMDEGHAAAAALAAAPTAALGTMRALLAESATSGFEVQLEREVRAISEAGGAPEFAEGLSAYLEKRAADFRGR